MNYKLDHIALRSKVLSESISYYSILAGKPSAIRTAGDGHNFCFINISGAAAIQLIESQTESGINHYAFVADDTNKVEGCRNSARGPRRRWPLYLCAIGARNSSTAAPILTLLVAELNLDS